jgi:spore germination protein KA
MEKTTLEQLRQSADYRTDLLDNGNFRIEILYFTTLCDTDVIKKEIAHPFLLSASAEAFGQVLHSALSCSPIDDLSRIPYNLLDGYAIVHIEDRYYKLKASKPGNEAPTDAVAETTLQGPQSAFSEDVDTNLLLLRKRYPSPDLVSEEFKLGKVTQTKSYLIYDCGKVNPDILKEFRHKLNGMEADMIQSAGQVEALITGSKYRWFPIMIVSERPDRAALNLALGKIVLVLDGTPYTLIAPAVFYDFMSAMDDIYQSFVVTRALVILRYVGVLITVTLPALYVAIVSYNPEIFKVQFALSLAGSRAAVPYPSFIEVFIMLFLIEALLEASLRLPRYIGSTATTVGGLILGQAAQQAGLVSSIMIIITSAVAISNFLIPINAMSFALRIAKYPLIVLASCFGVVGVVSGMFALVMYAANLQSFGMPYFRFFIGEPAVSGYKDGDTD